MRENLITTPSAEKMITNTQRQLHFPWQIPPSLTRIVLVEQHNKMCTVWTHAVFTRKSVCQIGLPAFVSIACPSRKHTQTVLCHSPEVTKPTWTRLQMINCGIWVSQSSHQSTKLGWFKRSRHSFVCLEGPHGTSFLQEMCILDEFPRALSLLGIRVEQESFKSFKDTFKYEQSSY